MRLDDEALQAAVLALAASPRTVQGWRVREQREIRFYRVVDDRDIVGGKISMQALESIDRLGVVKMLLTMLRKLDDWIVSGFQPSSK